jgi:hypothetical protein
MISKRKIAFRRSLQCSNNRKKLVSILKWKKSYYFHLHGLAQHTIPLGIYITIIFAAIVGMMC